MDDLAALLLDRRQRQEGAGRLQASLLLELALRRKQQILAGLRFALGDRPGRIVFVDEVRTAGMGQQDLDGAILNPVHQKPGVSRGVLVPLFEVFMADGRCARQACQPPGRQYMPRG